VQGLEVPRVREEAEPERLAGGAEHREVSQPRRHGGRLDMDEILVAQVLPRRGLVEVSRGLGEGPHPLHRDAGRVERRGHGRGLAHRLFHLPHHTVHGRKIGAHAHRQLGIRQRLGELGTQCAVGHLEAGGPCSRELQSEVDQRLERQARVGGAVVLRELHVHHARRETDPHRCPRPAHAAVRPLDPRARADHAALPHVARPARQSLEAIDDQGPRWRHGPDDIAAERGWHVRSRRPASPRTASALRLAFYRRRCHRWVEEYLRS
jgi:hypothetical protein